MLKRLLVFMFLLSYLLVTVATSVTTANAVKYSQAYNAAQPFVHAPDCQHRFYLQFDCFDRCNLVESEAQHANQPILLQAGGVDFHYMAPMPSTQLPVAGTGLMHFTSVGNALTPGFATTHYPPPIFS